MYRYYEQLSPGFMHMDMHPGNIMYKAGRPNHVKLIDYGRVISKTRILAGVETKNVFDIKPEGSVELKGWSAALQESTAELVLLAERYQLPAWTRSSGPWLVKTDIVRPVKRYTYSERPRLK